MSFKGVEDLTSEDIAREILVGRASYDIVNKLKRDLLKMQMLTIIMGVIIVCIVFNTYR